jgi:hypothetical protein
MKIHPVGAELFHTDGRTDGRTDRHDETNSRFSQFCKRAYNKEHVQLVIRKVHCRVLIFHSPVVTICTASLTFTHPMFCPHSVFMCFVWISEQTAIISLYNIN